jgi:hypothetical protein
LCVGPFVIMFKRSTGWNSHWKIVGLTWKTVKVVLKRYYN